jgi:4-hydroxy-tetrahydrodipicolinate synthase
VTQLWSGPAVALATLFDDDGGVAAQATAEHAARVVRSGLRAVLVCGSTGEASALTDEERVTLVRAVRQACPDVAVVAGSSGAWWGSAAQRTTAAVKAGADAVLVAPPPGVADLTEFFGRVADVVGPAQLFAYHFPPGAGGPVPVESLPALPIHGVKDSSADPERLLNELELAGWSGSTYVGSAVLTAYAGALGAAGAILAAANVAPEDCVAAFAGDGAAQVRLAALDRTASLDFPSGYKRAVADRFGTSAVTRIGS